MGWNVFPSFTVCYFLSPLIIRFDYKNFILGEQQYKIRLTLTGHQYHMNIIIGSLNVHI